MGEIDVFSAVPPTTEATETAFPLPEDFYRFIDQTQWNGAMRFPAVGPVAPQGWMTYRVFPISANFTLTWQVRQNQIWFLNPGPPPGQDLSSCTCPRRWCRTPTTPTSTRTSPARQATCSSLTAS